MKQEEETAAEMGLETMSHRQEHFTASTVVLTGGDFAHQEIFGNVWRHLRLSHLGVGSVYEHLPGARDAVKQLTVHRAALTTRSHQAQNGSSAEVQLVHVYMCMRM